MGQGVRAPAATGSREAGRAGPEMPWIVRRSPAGNNALRVREGMRHAARADQPRGATCGGYVRLRGTLLRREVQDTL